MEEIKLRLATDLTTAMKERDTVAVITIRSLLSEIDNAGAVELPVSEGMIMSGGIAGATEGVGSTEVQRKELSNEDIQKIITKEIDEIEKTALMIGKSGTDTSEFTEQIEILKGYLN